MLSCTLHACTDTAQKPTNALKKCVAIETKTAFGPMGWLTHLHLQNSRSRGKRLIFPCFPSLLSCYVFLSFAIKLAVYFYFRFFSCAQLRGSIHFWHSVSESVFHCLSLNLLKWLIDTFGLFLLYYGTIIRS